MTRTATVLVAAVLGLAGCGDDDSDTTSGTTSTTGNVPTGETTTDTTTTGETTTTSTSSSGGTGSGSGGHYDPEQDTEGNDLKPPEGSAAAEFEEQCDRNPGACS